MPEFYLDVHDDFPRWKRLDAFTQGYIHAMFYTDMEHGTDRDSWDAETQSQLPGDLTFADLSQSALTLIVADCAAFQAKFPTILDMARCLVPGGEGFKYGRDALDDTRLGQLFWYARNGHGVAFTGDGDAECLKALQRAAQSCIGRFTYLGDDDQVHIMDE